MSAFGAIERESTKMGLADVRRIDSRITVDNYTFDTVKEFIYRWFPHSIQ